MNHVHVCQWCDADYPSTGSLSEVREDEWSCDCDGPPDACRECSPELYQPVSDCAQERDEADVDAMNQVRR